MARRRCLAWRQAFNACHSVNNVAFNVGTGFFSGKNESSFLDIYMFGDIFYFDGDYFDYEGRDYILPVIGIKPNFTGERKCISNWDSD